MGNKLRCYWISYKEGLLVHLQTNQGLKVYVLTGVQRKVFGIFINSNRDNGVAELSDEDSNSLRVFIEDILAIKEQIRKEHQTKASGPFDRSQRSKGVSPRDMTSYLLHPSRDQSQIV